MNWRSRRSSGPRHLRLLSNTSPALCQIAGARLSSQQQKTWEVIMTNLTQLPDHQANAASSALDRRTLLRGATAIAATAIAASDALARDYGRNAEPQRY